ncbi:FHA domain protein [Vulgatibacter incomptus]|uniref:FHA domain protein n=1 Tax=Vulgatibacter incomptus TaxID=1391653 RepID=A0A0K1PAZ7_9BACT|nr:FHA domain protein [Vulgatibacter incomptus]
MTACRSCGETLTAALWLASPSFDGPASSTPGPMETAERSASTRSATPGPTAAGDPGRLATPGPSTPGERTVFRGFGEQTAFREAPQIEAPDRILARPAPLHTLGPVDGVDLPSVPGNCPRCGRSHPARLHFCPSCGMRLGSDAGRATRRPPAGLLAPGSVKLVLLRGLGASGTAFPLREEHTEAGRTVGALRFPSDDTLSPLAATFSYRGGRLFVRDEGGPSGVFIRLLLPEVLREGAWFSIGDKLLRFLDRVPPPQPSHPAPRLLGSARPAGTLLRIQLVHLGGIPGRIFSRPAPVRIGRALGEILLTDDPFISARHCELDHDPSGAILRDLGSSNGSFLRLPPNGERELYPGDTVRLGRNILRVE